MRLNTKTGFLMMDGYNCAATALANYVGIHFPSDELVNPKVWDIMIGYRKIREENGGKNVGLTLKDLLSFTEEMTGRPCRLYCKDENGWDGEGGIVDMLRRLAKPYRVKNPSAVEEPVLGIKIMEDRSRSHAYTVYGSALIEPNTGEIDESLSLDDMDRIIAFV